MDEEVKLAKTKNEYYMIKSSHAMGGTVQRLRSADLRANQLSVMMNAEPITEKRNDLEYKVMQLTREYEMLLEQSKILRALISHEGNTYDRKKN
jgi:hypothetical protein